MGSESFLFKNPVSALARKAAPDDGMTVGCWDSVDARVEIVQDGFKMRICGEKFVAKTLDEAMDTMKSQLSEKISELKKNDK